MPLTGEYEPSTSDWVRENAEVYLTSGGQQGTELQGYPVILLTTVGAKTGKLRKTPLMRVEHEGEYAVVASLGVPRRTRFGTTTSWRIRASSYRTVPSPTTTTHARCSEPKRRSGGSAP